MAAAPRLLQLSEAWLARGRFVEASELAEAAAVVAGQEERWTTRARALNHQARALCLGSADPSAVALFVESARLFEQEGDRASAMLVRLREIFARYDQGDLSAAQQGLRGLRPEQSVARGLHLGYRANVARSLGAYSDARTLYRSASEVVATDERYGPTFLMDQGVTSLLEGDATAAIIEFRQARKRLAEPPDPMLHQLLSHYELLSAELLDEQALVAEARRRFDSLGLRTLGFLDRTHRIASIRVEHERAQALLRLEESCPSFEHGRLTLRVLRRFHREAPPRGRVLRACLRGDVVEVHLEDSAAFEVRFASPQGRILVALLEAAPKTVPLSTAALIQVGWPGERVQPRAARNRLHVALTSLRRRGLRGVLVASPDGYFLDPATVRVLS